MMVGDIWIKPTRPDIYHLTRATTNLQTMQEEQTLWGVGGTVTAAHEASQPRYKVLLSIYLLRPSNYVQPLSIGFYHVAIEPMLPGQVERVHLFSSQSILLETMSHNKLLFSKSGRSNFSIDFFLSRYIYYIMMIR